jgi:predicted RecB family nuclease
VDTLVNVRPNVVGQAVGATSPNRKSKKTPKPISKTDFTDYLRCPFTFWLLARGQLIREQTINPGLLHLLSEGTEFEDQLLGDPIALDGLGADVVGDPKDEKDLLQNGKLVLRTGLYENRRLGILGVPDGIDPAGGAMVPIEVKSHARPTSLDRLELAFYWLVLAPYRGPGDHPPRGLLVLRGRDGCPNPIEVALTDRDLHNVVRRLPMIRKARRYRPLTGLCNCYVCSVVYREEVLAQAHGAGDVSLLFGVGPVHGDALRRVGIRTYADLLDHDPDQLHDLINKEQRRYGQTQLAGWIQHARAYTRRRPVLFGSPTPMPIDYLCLDLEYVTFGDDLVWAAGIQRRDGPLTQLWASAPAYETTLLTDLARLLDENAGVPIVTWGGVGADLPALLRAATRHTRASPLAGRVHLDLYQWACRHLRLPMPGLSVKAVASFFDLPRISDEIIDGFMAHAMYQQAVAEDGTPHGHEIKQQLLNYNADDVVTLGGIIEILRALIHSLTRPEHDQGGSPAGPQTTCGTA